MLIKEIKKIIVQTAITKSTESISYIYSASGEKLAKRMKDNTYQYYAGNMVYKNDKSLNYILFEEGLVNKSSSVYVYEYHLKDHLGNTRVTFQPNGGSTTTTQVVEYYPFGSTYSPLSPAGTNKYLYNGKEKQDDVLSSTALDEYDYGHRYFDPLIARFTSIDRKAEKFPWQTTYCYASNNPIKFIDILGDSATFKGDGAQEAIDLLNNKLAGFYNFSINENGLVSMNPVNTECDQQEAINDQTPMTNEQSEFANQLDLIINGNGMTTMNVVKNDNNVLIGDISTHTMDIGDVKQFGEGIEVDQSGAFIHEFNEQYNAQEKNYSPLSSHIGATITEGKVTGNVYNPNRPLSGPVTGTGTITVPIRDSSTGQWCNVYVNYENGNVTSITR